MALRSIRVEGFRGIRSAEVSFDRTTVLIGENDCGIPDLLDAIAMALSPDAELETGRLQLTFVESRAGSWGRPGLEALTPNIGRRATKPRTLTLEIDNGHWTAGTSRDDAEVLAAVRRINPLVRLRHGAPTDGSTGGFAAAKELLDKWAPNLRPRPREMRAMVKEILAHGAENADVQTVTPQTEPTAQSRSAAQELSVYLVTAQIVHELQRTNSHGVRPMMIVEDPEAHLHPMTLASVGALLDLFPVQKIVTTNSGTVLGATPLQSVRRLVRDAEGHVEEHHIGREGMRKDDLRKVSYHLRARRSVACFARVWLLVEGETEFWALPDLARLCGYDFAQEGIACVEFAQCGLVPLITLADRLGIEWHVLTDGDRAGAAYSEQVRPYIKDGDGGQRLTRIPDLDIEHCFWESGYAPVFERLAKTRARGNVTPTKVIKKAIDASSKPGVAFELLAAVAARRQDDGVPPPLRTAIETCIWLARGGIGDNQIEKRSDIHEDHAARRSRR